MCYNIDDDKWSSRGPARKPEKESEEKEMKAYYYENNSRNGVMLVVGDRFIAFNDVFCGTRGLDITRENIPQIVTDIADWYSDDDDFNYLFDSIESDTNGGNNVTGYNAKEAIEDQDYTELIFIDLDEQDEDEQDDDEQDEDEQDETRRDYDYLLDTLTARADKLAQRVNDLYACAGHQGRRAAKYEARGDKKKMRECEAKMNDFFAVARHLQSAARVLGFAWIEDHFVFVCDPDF